ncbi:MAG: hypothetical protein HETSPECPRED_006665 [Heterodermia speciosa]|uniref:Amino acid transporter n=1 Tax=Heterodermia speciosa TaxID=116794 RepID=A0A8H3FNG2_9LECA|nr:MAG: hypothetical protein HETSPECPRED_006665 [Heterodermia speciosa]
MSAGHFDGETASAAAATQIEEETAGAVIIGDVQKVPRTTGFFQVIAVAFNLLSSWLTVASTLILGLSHGGSVAVLYGLVVILIMYGAVALSLAEMAARYTTAGGQYHWTALLAPDKMKRGLSYACGSINAIGRVAMTASIDIIVARLLLAIIAFNIPSYTIERWHTFMLYQVLNIVTLTYNLAALKRAPWTHNIGFILSLASFFVISITCLAITQPKQSSYSVWHNFINNTGWDSDGFVFLLGLINPTYGFGGLDGAVHLAEDCFEPAKIVPRALCYSLVIGFVTAFFFAVTMLYCVKDIEAAINSRTGVPIYEVWYQATESGKVATIFMASMMAAAFVASIGSVQTSSRLTWSLARDDAIVLSRWIKRTNDGLGVPVWALLFNGFWLSIVGSFNVFIGTAMLTELISFSFPAALLMWQGRNQRYLPTKSPFNLGKFGWLVNALVVGWTLFALVIFSFPVEKPVTPSSMNYTAVVLGLMALLAILNWVFYARIYYQGPNVTLLVKD